MLAPIIFAGFMLLASAIALLDWRRGWLLAILCTFMEDPARKLTPGTPVVMTLSVVIIYLVVLFSAQSQLQRQFHDLAQRFSRVYGAVTLFFFFLLLAAVRGIATFGLELWRVPALSLFIYTVPIPAIVLGYAYAQREENIFDVFRFYAAVTIIGLIGTPLEYYKIHSPALGMVASPGGFTRYLPGIQIRLLSGFYRAPDIMGWHAAMLTMIGMTMAIRTRSSRYVTVWILVAGWGFLNCILSGRRKAIYMVAAFVAVFVWRYWQRLRLGQGLAFVAMGLMMLGVINNLRSKEESSVYAEGASTTRSEVFQRLEGGLFGTIEQFGFMGAGLGTATQGVRHFLGHDQNIGWQEGGLGKLAIEVGVPGVLAAAATFLILVHTLMTVTAYPDEEGSTQLLRCALFGIFLGNVANFMASAQAYSDAGLALLTCFFLGCLLATATLNERLRESTLIASRESRGLTSTATA